MTSVQRLRPVTFRGGPYDGTVIECSADTIEAINPELVTVDGHFVIGYMIADAVGYADWPSTWSDYNELFDADGNELHREGPVTVYVDDELIPMRSYGH